MNRILPYILFLFCSLCLYPQSTIKLDTKQDHGGTVLACQVISLKPGFSFSSGSGKTLNLKVDPTTCDPFAGKEANLSKDQNYIRTRTYTNESGSRYLDQIQYFDGLGRPTQTVQRGITPQTQDLTSFQDYDAFGRESNSWLPIVTVGNGKMIGSNQIDAIKQRGKDSDYKDQSPYNLPVYEPSPLNRITKQYGPGQNWQNTTNNRADETYYLTNDQSSELSCILFSITGSGINVGLQKGSLYPTGELYVTKIIDENKNRSYEFKDKLGQVVLTRQISKINTKDTNHDTYYVYDDFGNQCYVLPPICTDEILAGGVTGASIERLGYLYKYDSYNRCIVKKIPGAERIYYVYDKADRMILSQDGEQRTKKTADKTEWTFNKYDALGRLVVSGIYKTNLSHQTLQNTFKDTVVKEEYKRDEWYSYTWKTMRENVEVNDVLIVNYYDDYDSFLSLKLHTDYKTMLSYQPKSDYGQQYIHPDMQNRSAKGLLVGSRIKIIDSEGKTQNAPLREIGTALYYDNKGRVIQTHTTDHLGGYTSEYIAYNFTGQPTKKLQVHTDKTATKTEELYSYTYDHAGRLLLSTHKLGAKSAVTLAHNTYDELGRLKSSTKNGQATLKTDYSYTIRSWTKSMTSPDLKQNLDYDFSGNITNYQWTQENKTRNYTYGYDGLSRLLDAKFTGATGENYTSSYRYDKHGNMTTLSRMGKKDAGTATTSYAQIDNLTLSYTGNQLKNVHDAAANVPWSESSDFKDYSKDPGQTKVEYIYNANGAMKQDLNKGISEIQYNYLNLPRTITIANTSHQGTIKYTYSVSGAKLRTVHTPNLALYNSPLMGTVDYTQDALTKAKTTDYVGNKVYENGSLKRILIDGGYIEDGNYYFYQSDHLGNNRIVAKASGQVVQRTHYYPFGMAFADSQGSELQPYKYNNKELDKELGLEIYDYAARQRGNDIPVFLTGDPHSENYYSWSPYAYVGNNPMKYTDPTGMDWWEDEFGVTTWQSDITEKNVPKGGKYIGKSYEGFSISQNIWSNTDGTTYALTQISYNDPDGKTLGIGGWVQTVDTNSPLKGDSNPKVDPGQVNPRTDKIHDNYPYYHTKSEYEYSKNSPDSKRTGRDAYFQDQPSRFASTGNFNWEAEISLMGNRLKGGGLRGGAYEDTPLSPIISLKWGFSRNGSNIKLHPISVVNPSSFHHNAIKKIK